MKIIDKILADNTNRSSSYRCGEYIRLDTHKDISELTREALREKIKRDAPHLFEELFMNKKSGRKQITNR